MSDMKPGESLKFCQDSPSASLRIKYNKCKIPTSTKLFCRGDPHIEKNNNRLSLKKLKILFNACRFPIFHCEQGKDNSHKRPLISISFDIITFLKIHSTGAADDS